MKRKNIVFVLRNFEAGGVQELLIQLLGKIDLNVFTPFIVCTKDIGPLYVRLPGSCKNIYVLGTDKFYNPIALLKLIKFLLKNKIDIIHSHQFVPDILSRIAGKITNTKLIISSYHNVYPWKSSNKLNNRIKRFFDSITANYFTNEIIAVSNAVREYHIKYLKINENKIKVVNNFINDAIYISHTPKEVDDLKSQLGIPKDSQIILNVASLTKQKNHQLLLKVAKRILVNFPRTIFCIAGEGELHDDLVLMSEKLDIKKNIKFLGRRDDIYLLLQISDIFVLSSLWEGMPVTIIEAMAMRTPVVSTNVGGVSDAITHNVNGFLASSESVESLYENILNLLNNYNLRVKIRDEGYRTYKEKFSSDKILSRLYDIYSMNNVTK